MFKVVFLVCGVLAVLIQARPSYLPSYEHVEYAPSVVGYESYALPAAVSHQSSTVVHEKRPYWRPIVDHTPILKTAYAPATSISYAPLGYAGSSAGWYEPGIWGGASYPSIYLK
ncbi:uncharacterized protein LOC6738286 [Drosophila simulans]|uniref:GD14617 n=1 Tax=Drosophila simulans TaxID=7240 RepID=B4QMB3_DROSI|nr:uncharacterized protein LOC6738286 [Drosophila simulans]EDX10682.1 GD14617 [Drosophila simulans]KMY99996.1 uncharacterized protein Dsimw501_GD14617 [Drosophila simulans]